MLCSLRRRLKEDKGQNLVEFAISGFLLVMLLLSVVEIGRLMLVYTTVANAARMGARYAIVHGSDSPVTVSNVQSAVRTFLSTAPMDTTAAVVGVTYPDVGSCTQPGCHVQVTVTYPYDPFVGYFPFGSINLGSSTQGVITF